MSGGGGFSRIVVVGVFLFFSITLSAGPHSSHDDGSSAAPPAVPPTAQAFPVEMPPELDGDLNDPVWLAAVPLVEFWQSRPDEGQFATEKTEVRIIYTSDTLYFGVLCYDRDPSSIVVSGSRRDSSLEETDSFQIIMDTYQDRQNGFVFGTNPAAIEYDGQVVNEGQGGGMGPGGSRQMGGSGGGFNINWDGSWDVRTRLLDEGWSIEFAIPFRTLRFPSVREQVWGLNFQRNIRSRNEQSFWAPIPRQFNLYRLSMAGTLTGLEISEQRNLKLMPYALGEVRSAGTEETVATGDWGIDVKYSLTPSLTLDGTYNTDFAQVEVDEFQINLDRFNLFFPEKRPFFLENAGLFAVGDLGEAELFFSRRIGIGPDGEVIPILGGVRVTGKTGGMNVGFLNLQTEGLQGVTSANNFTVARVSRELPNRSALGGIFVNRLGTGEFASNNDFNRTYGFDGRWGIGRYGEVSGFLAGTDTPGMEGNELGFRIGSSYNSEHWQLSADYTELGEDFNPEVGFLAREGGYRKPSAMILYRYHPDFLGFYQWRPHVSYRGFWTREGFQQTGYLHVDNHWEWRNGYEVHTGINFTKEGLEEPFEIYPDIEVPTGVYEHKEAQLVANTNRADWISFSFRTNFGGFFGGDRVALTPAMQLRLRETFSTELNWSRNDVDLPVASFRTNLARLRVSYSFTPRVYLQALVQFNDRDEIWSTNLRFGWLQSANTGLFVVYNDSRGLEDFDPTTLPDRSLTVKYNRLFDLLD